ncbi:MAG: rhodanese-like domain-containing protein [Bdellovibrionales bacterium]|nr:rhodanese-like domain-containing protein [Bdellovibrionales bacterium]
MSKVSFQSLSQNPHYKDVSDISPEEVWLKKDELYLVDVRGEDEYFGELGHVAGAKLIVLDTLENHLQSLPQNLPVVFICRSGMRSAKASQLAIEAGLTNTYNMMGGMICWNAHSLETEA